MTDAIPPAPALRLVLVDDDADSRELFAEYLRLEGFEVEEHETAEDALASILLAPPALVVTDVTLIRMSGCDAARQLRANPRTATIPIVAVTGRYAYDLGEDRLLFDAVMVKPVEATKLVATVRDMLARGAAPANDAGENTTT